MRVLFLTRYPVEGASSRYRVYQYVPYLESLGVECHVSSFMTPKMYRMSFRHGRTAAKAWATVWAALKRTALVLGHRRYDVIYMQRELLPFGPPIIERWMKRRGATLVFDLDDALFIHKASRYNPIATWLRSPGKTYEIFRLCDLVLAGNDYLRDTARKHCQRAETLEVAEDTDRIRMRPPQTNNHGVTIGWLGSTSTVKYLRLIEPVLRRLQERYPFIRLEIVGGGEFDMPGLAINNVPWSLDGELRSLERFDIGLMPLPPEEWSRGKSGGKARTYMAAGVPPVCTNIGYNIELLRDGETGFLCESEADWERALTQLIEDPELRQRLGEAARADVMVRFPLAGTAERMRDLLEEAHRAKDRQPRAATTATPDVAAAP